MMQARTDAHERRQMVAAIEQALHSDAFKRRIEAIHRHYPNLKSEGRYRDALLEVFNDMQHESGLLAYAEANKVDLVVTHPHSEGADGWLRVEFKYHFTYDVAHRVAPRLSMLSSLSDTADCAGRLREKSRGDLRDILIDCFQEKGAGAAGGYRCDMFVLIVQDRRRAARPPGARPRSRKGRPPSCGTVFARGVAMQFLHEQIDFDATHEEDARYDRAWRDPLHAMFSGIHQRRAFRLLPPVRHEMPAMHHEVPLTSHVFALDFTQAGTLPASL